MTGTTFYVLFENTVVQHGPFSTIEKAREFAAPVARFGRRGGAITNFAGEVVAGLFETFSGACLGEMPEIAGGHYRCSHCAWMGRWPGTHGPVAFNA